MEQPLKKRLNAGGLPLVAAVDLSYLSAKEQKTVSELAEREKIKLDVDTAKHIKDMAGDVTEKRVLEHFEDKKEKKANTSKDYKNFYRCV